MAFVDTYREYVENAGTGMNERFNLDTISRIEPILGFLYQNWWKVELQGFKHLPKHGPVLLVGNAGGIVPWAALMLLYALMRDKEHSRRLNIMIDLDWIEDERLYNLLTEIGFVSWSADNARRLFAENETVVIFPEGIQGWVKPFGERYRLRQFDWTKIMPAVEANVRILPLATLGPDESFPVGKNLEGLAKLLSLPALPVTPFFPLMPFPMNLFSLPVRWQMRIIKQCDYPAANSREEVEETAKTMALFTEGEVQAELNRLLRKRIKPLF